MNFGTKITNLPKEMPHLSQKKHWSAAYRPIDDTYPVRMPAAW